MSDATDDSHQPVPPPAPGRGHPLLATAIAVLVLLLMSFVMGNARDAVFDPHERGGYLIGGAILGLLLWLVCFAITIRHASGPWKLASLLVLLAGGIGLAHVQLARADAAQDAEIAGSMAQLKAVAATGRHQPLTAAADAGPIARMAVTAANLAAADNRAYDAALAATGFSQLFTVQGLTRQSPVLGQCPQIDGLSSRTAVLAMRTRAYAEAAGSVGTAEVKNGKLSQQAVDRVVAGMSQQWEAIEQHWHELGKVTDDGAALCRLLAQRRWQAGADGKLQFRNQADQSTANSLLEQMRSRLDQIRPR